MSNISSDLYRSFRSVLISSSDIIFLLRSIDVCVCRSLRLNLERPLIVKLFAYDFVMQKEIKIK